MESSLVNLFGFLLDIFFAGFLFATFLFLIVTLFRFAIHR